MDKKLQNHWQSVYQNKDISKVSWAQKGKSLSFELILKYSTINSKIIDCGSGASNLVDELLNSGYSDITLLDISNEALKMVEDRIGNKAQFIAKNILDFDVKNNNGFDIWHDRAVLHFLTKKSEIEKYFEILKSSLGVGGMAIIASFATDKIRKCSDLNTQSYDKDSMLKIIGDDFKMLEFLVENHQTPNGDSQLFNYFCLQKT